MDGESRHVHQENALQKKRRVRLENPQINCFGFTHHLCLVAWAFTMKDSTMNGFVTDSCQECQRDNGAVNQWRHHCKYPVAHHKRWHKANKYCNKHSYQRVSQVKGAIQISASCVTLEKAISARGKNLTDATT
jgi:hypothetical protein